MPTPDPLIFVKMKARRADEHFQSLENELGKWSVKPYTIVEQTDFEQALHIFKINVTPTPEIVPMLFGDFICCLRAALDQLAWKLAHLPPIRNFDLREQRQINFPIFGQDDATYRNKLSLFPSTVTDLIDTLQPYHRANAFKDDPLWQLDKLWTLDKHRTIPTLPYLLTLGFGIDDWQSVSRHRLNRFTYDLEVAFPLALIWNCKVNLKPEASIETLFGETGNFEIPLNRLREINDFVRNGVIPRFTRFFP